MAIQTTVGKLLINEILPDKYKITGPITNKSLHEKLVPLAKEAPMEYVKTITALKNRGDRIATLEGVSVGLEDIKPQYAERDKILDPIIKKVESVESNDEKRKHIVDAQEKLLNYTKKHPGSMTQMALSGARGNAAQLMKIVGTPLAAVNPKRGVDPFIIKRSYSEGLTPAEYWVTIPEVRYNEVQARISVSEPGEVAKVLVNNMINKIITTTDCGTKAGIHMSIDDGHIIDRYIAGTHDLITPTIVQNLKSKGTKELLVRSPMTCAAQTGVCQFCQGLDEKGKLHTIGSPIGVRAAQAMAEPLTQMALSSRHGSLTIKNKAEMPEGLKGVRQMLDIPNVFQHEAVLSPIMGVISKIEKAPQGGNYIYLGKIKLYASPEQELKITEGQTVEPGDPLTSGVPHPAKLVNLKGIGEGRKQFVNTLHQIYKNEGVDIEKRHLEILAKSEMNHIRLLDQDEEHPELLKGDVINYNAFKQTYAKDSIEIPTRDAIGKKLGEEILHYTVGTTITPTLAKELVNRGINVVKIAKSMPNVEFIMKPFTQNPMLDSDWMGRLSHRFLSSSLQQTAHLGEISDIHGSHPVPAYAYGAEMRKGPGGTY